MFIEKSHNLKEYLLLKIIFQPTLIVRFFNISDIHILYFTDFYDIFVKSQKKVAAINISDIHICKMSSFDVFYCFFPYT